MYRRAGLQASCYRHFVTRLPVVIRSNSRPSHSPDYSQMVRAGNQPVRGTASIRDKSDTYLYQVPNLFE